MKSLYMQRHIN